MKFFFRFVLAVALIAIIGVCGYQLWTISDIYVSESQVKNETKEYRPQLSADRYSQQIQAIIESRKETGQSGGLADDPRADGGTNTPSAGGAIAGGTASENGSLNSQSGGSSGDVSSISPGDASDNTQGGASVSAPGGASDNSSSGASKNTPGGASDNSSSNASENTQGGASDNSSSGASVDTPGDAPGGPSDDASANQGIVKMQNDVNPEVLGWLTIPDTHIDYPVVRAAENDYYLQRDIYGNRANAGSIFMDSRCPADFSAFNTIIYGHNMKNRSMFGDIREFADIDYFNENLYGLLYLPEETYMLDFFAYLVVRADDAVIYGTRVAKDEFYSYTADAALNYREPVSQDKVITLSTCAYNFDDARMVLLATPVLLQ